MEHGFVRFFELRAGTSSKIIQNVPLPKFRAVCGGSGTMPAATMDSKKLALLCRDYADNRKAEDVVVLDVHDLSSVTDYFVIASGTSEPHLRAIVEEITGRLRDEHDIRPIRTDGSTQGTWVA